MYTQPLGSALGSDSDVVMLLCDHPSLCHSCETNISGSKALGPSRATASL